MSEQLPPERLTLPRDCDHEEALMDHIMTAPIEALAAEEGKTVEEMLEEGRQVKERIIANLKAKGLWK